MEKCGHLTLYTAGIAHLSHAITFCKTDTFSDCVSVLSSRCCWLCCSIFLQRRVKGNCTTTNYFKQYSILFNSPHVSPDSNSKVRKINECVIIIIIIIIIIIN